MSSITVSAPADFHVHLRQGDISELIVPHVRKGGFDLVYVMPNLRPPITSTEQALKYKAELERIDPDVEYLMTLYLSPELTPEEIRKASAAGIAGVKSYPRGVTTNSDGGIESYETYYPIFAAMEEVGMVLNLHGEVPSDPEANVHVLNAEVQFLPHLFKIHQAFPKLRIVLEHATTRAAIEAVKKCGPTVGCTITAHHLALIVDDWAGQSWNFCKPVAKYPDDRLALREVIKEGHPRFFLGSDSAPHPPEAKSRSSPNHPCAAGVYTSPILLPLVAHLLESFGALDKLEGFVSSNGRAFYQRPFSSQKTGRELVTLRKVAPRKVEEEYSLRQQRLVPFWAEYWAKGSTWAGVELDDTQECLSASLQGIQRRPHREQLPAAEVLLSHGCQDAIINWRCYLLHFAVARSHHELRGARQSLMHLGIYPYLRKSRRPGSTCEYFRLRNPTIKANAEGQRAPSWNSTFPVITSTNDAPSSWRCYVGTVRSRSALASLPWCVRGDGTGSLWFFGGFNISCAHAGVVHVWEPYLTDVTESFPLLDPSLSPHSAMAANLSPAERLALLVDTLNAGKTVGYIGTGSLAMLACDYLHTFPEEVKYMWKSANTIPKFLFLALRYYAFVHSSFSQSYHNDFHITGDQCLNVFYRDTYSALVVSILCEMISYTRVYAFSGKNIYVTIWLIAFFIVEHSLQFWFLSKFLRTVRFATFPIEDRFGCVPSEGEGQWLSLIFILFLCSLCMVTFIMIFIGVRRSRVFGAKGLVRIFYRDGIFYFISLALLSVINVIFTYTAPTNGLQFAMIQLQVHLNAILGERMLLHLREYADTDVDNGSYAMHVRPSGEHDKTLKWAAATPRRTDTKGPYPGGITVGSTTMTWVD
ncbi:hypothetical protein NMY22_g606 [Coprinellus aureogranulatus]|nr:hypothetical protein NMY22_g606 [Coprinellus aureogranulatus]